MNFKTILASWVLFAFAVEGTCAREVFFRGGDEPAQIAEINNGFASIDSDMNFKITATNAALLTIHERNGLAVIQEQNQLYFGHKNPSDGSYTFKSIAEVSAVTPTIAGNTIRYPGLWTFQDGSGDLELTITKNGILKEIILSASAAACLPSPTAAEFFPEADPADIYLCVGANQVMNVSAEVTGDMDGFQIDLMEDQVLGDRFIFKYNGGFLFEVLPVYCNNLLDSKGQQIYLGDLQAYFAVWEWEQAKAATKFDPSYSFQTEGIFADTFVYEAGPYDNYCSHILDYMMEGSGGWGGGYSYYSILNIDTVKIINSYGIHGVSSSIDVEINDVAMKMTPRYSGAPTAYDVKVFRAAQAGAIDALTWNTKTTALEPLYTYDVASWTDGATHTYNDATLTTALRKCIVGATYCQFYLKPLGGDNSNWGAYHSLNNGTYGYNPVLTMNIVEGWPYTQLMNVNNNFFLSDRHIGLASLTVSASLTNSASPLNFGITMSASGWFNSAIANPVQIATSVNAVSAANVVVGGASPTFYYYIHPVTYENISVAFCDPFHGSGRVVYYASNPLDVWTPYSAVHKGSTAQILASTYSLMSGGWMQYWAYDGAQKVQCGTSATTQNSDYGIVEVSLPLSQQDNSIHLGVENHLPASVSKAVFSLDYGGGGGSSSIDYDAIAATIMTYTVRGGCTAAEALGLVPYATPSLETKLNALIVNVTSEVNANEVLINDVSSYLVSINNSIHNGTAAVIAEIDANEALIESASALASVNAEIIEAASDWIASEVAAVSAYIASVSAVTGAWISDLATRTNSAMQVAAASQPMDVTAYAVSGAHIERTDGGWTGKVLGPRDAYVGDVSHLVRYMPIVNMESGELEWKFQGLIFDWAHDATPAYAQRKIGTPFFDTFSELETYIENEARPSGSGAAFSTASPSF